MRRWLGLWWVLGVQTWVLATGCSPAPTSTPTPTPLPLVDPAAVLQRAVAQVLALKSVAFTLEHQIGTTMLFPGLEMSKASGVVDIPEKFSLKVEAELEFPRSYVEINIVTIGDQAYMTDFVTGQWREVPLDALPVSLGGLGRTLADIIEAVEAPQLAGAEQLRGRDAWRVTGRVRSQDLAGLVPGAAEDLEVALELWLDQGDGLLLQALITGPVLPTDVPEAVRLLVLDQFNVPVNITPPE
ncbi:MAG: LppX_LprAFG lipoprotein [Chloroflexi bacterium]|nr:LppX_LprAFG lipoprotein [Chloroflexota bacterium]MCI0786299.1 LppX_LprAFG lipoprotein [Chloroflexota bacterium]MCI0792615.1 LppX_LprAFG lipoprotein [Chloroflexota bacterium]